MASAGSNGSDSVDPDRDDNSNNGNRDCSDNGVGGDFWYRSTEYADDPPCEFSRSGNDGCFWVIWEDFLDTFNEVFVVHVFDDSVFQYCVQGEWGGHSAAGKPATKSHASVAAASGGVDGDQVHAGTASSSKSEKPIGKTKWCVLQDAEA